MSAAPETVESLAGVLTDEDKQVIQRTWRLVVPIRETAADLFYQRLFEKNPQYRPLFKSDLVAQKRKLVTMLSFIVKALDWKLTDWEASVQEEEDLFLVVLALGRRHHELYRVPDEAYDGVGEALLWTLSQGLGDAFTPQARKAWTQVYGLLATIMKMGETASSLGAPLEASDWDEMTQ